MSDTAAAAPPPPPADAPPPIRPALAKLEAGFEALPIIPRNLDEVARYAEWYIQAGMVPESLVVEYTSIKVDEFGGDDKAWRDGRVKRSLEKTRARVMIVIEAGLEVGMGPVTALKSIMIVNNRPSMWGDGLVALCQRNNQVANQEVTYVGSDGEAMGAEAEQADMGTAIPKLDDNFTCVVKYWRRGQTNPYIGKFSVRDAKRAKLWGNTKRIPWIQHPLRMLKARAQAFALRDGFADCILGLSVAEEQFDIALPAPEERPSTTFLDDAPGLGRSAPATAAIEHKPETPLPQNMAGSPTREAEPRSAPAAGPAEASAASPAAPAKQEPTTKK